MLKFFHHLGKILKENGDSTNVGNEGGYAPAKINGTEGALDIISQAVERAGYKLGEEIAHSHWMRLQVNSLKKTEISILTTSQEKADERTSRRNGRMVCRSCC